MSIHIAKTLKPNSTWFHRWEHPEADTIHSASSSSSKTHFQSILLVVVVVGTPSSTSSSLYYALYVSTSTCPSSL